MDAIPAGLGRRPPVVLLCAGTEVALGAGEAEVRALNAYIGCGGAGLVIGLDTKDFWEVGVVVARVVGIFYLGGAK